MIFKFTNKNGNVEYTITKENIQYFYKSENGAWVNNEWVSYHGYTFHIVFVGGRDVELTEETYYDLILKYEQ